MISFRKNVTCEEKKEFFELVNECMKRKFRESREVTSYIMKNKLGYKYRHIAGHLHMNRGTDEWTYEGGISPEYYGKLCQALNLNKRVSNAKAKGFESFAELSLY